MKALEYYQVYGKPVMDEITGRSKTHENVQSFLNAFEEESIRIMRSRKPQNDRAVIAVLKQQNQKWNNICNLIERDYGYTPFKRNAYWKVMRDELGIAV